MQGSGSVDSLDPVELDVAGGARTADPGQRVLRVEQGDRVWNVGDQAEVLTLRVHGRPLTTLSVALFNIFDQDPPFARLDQNFDPFTASPLGFTAKLGVSQAF